MKNGQIITALDIGTTKICTIIASLGENNKLEVKGIGITESHGLEKGIVRDITRASSSIRASIMQAEEDAGVAAENIYAGIAGEHIKSQNSLGKISLNTNTNRAEPIEISDKHVEQVIHEAKNAIQMQRDNQNLEIIHGIPQFFDIDDQSGILNPIAMSGFQLTAHVHVVMANISALKNIRKCIDLAGFKANEIVLEPIASAKAVLNKDEFDLGCILIDIGGGTTDIAVFYKDSIRFTNIKPVGGKSVTHDIAIGLRTPLDFAEKIKINSGNALASKVSEEETIHIEGIGGRDASEKKLKFISEIIEYRLRETLEIAYKTVIHSYHKDLMTAGVILTGGASLLKNIDGLAAEIFNLPVKIGYPNLKALNSQVPQLNNPKFATAVGLLYYGQEELPVHEKGGRRRKTKKDKNVSGQFVQAFRKIIDNITEYL